jgi:hypothetical protein
MAPALAPQARPESKRWIDPAIIERNFQEHEAAADAEDKRRATAAADARTAFRRTASQILTLVPFATATFTLRQTLTLTCSCGDEA